MPRIPPAPPGPGQTASERIINCPVEGTFYRAPSPDDQPFVEVGASVRVGQVLCIIEASKLVNEIESDLDGVVTEFFPQNAQPVVFGEPLCRIQT